PWDYLKIDRRLVVEATRSRSHRHLLEALQSFAVRSGSRLVAEGIESSEELRLCTELRVALGQGYLLARPRLWDQASGGSGDAGSTPRE
ncbi:MAG: EAL domain-containing protein, partial [Clostridia bacterium]|nr:EAL domain-containing protein [Clostridia bacterium]